MPELNSHKGPENTRLDDVAFSNITHELSTEQTECAAVEFCMFPVFLKDPWGYIHVLNLKKNV